MSEIERTDVIVVGGGWVGMVAAAALASASRSVLVLEARAGTDPRFRGELVHTGGVKVLRELGLADALERDGAYRAKGFAVITGRKDETLTLDYPEGYGLAMDHHEMVRSLRRSAAGRPGVTIRTGQRVMDVVREGDRVVGVKLADGSEVHAALTVVADGRHSRLRPLLGLDGSAELLSFTAAIRVDGVALPEAQHGTVMLSPLGPILAYEVGHEQVRMCVDIPTERAKGTKRDLAKLLTSEYAPHVPEPLRTHMLRAIAEGHVEMCANQEISTDRVAVKGAVIVGDAAGCPHPLCAGGMTVGAQDVASLRDALATVSAGSAAAVWDEALLRHERTRYRRSRGREVLARALYDVFLAASEGARALREGMFRYWRASERARTASMGLLAGEDARIASFAREYVTVMGYSLGAIADEGKGASVSETLARRWSLWSSAWSVAKQPLSRSGRFTWIEALRQLGKRPEAAVPHGTANAPSASAPQSAASVSAPPASERAGAR
jgi:squalene monooxygenase